jgi:hydroxyacylglutathione hydrolase
VDAVLAGQPEPPRYFAEMKRINKEGPRILGGFSRPERLAGGRMVELLAQGRMVVDARPAGAFAIRHIPGTVSIPLDRSFTTWAGWLVPYAEDFYLIVDDRCRHCIDEAVRDLAMIGLDRVAGYFGSEVVDSWEAAGRKLQSVPQVSVAELEARMRDEDVAVVDVRGAAEWEAGRIPGVPNIPLGYLEERLEEIPADRPVVAHCQGGARSAIAAGLLQAKGYGDVLNLSGGFAEWHQDGRPVETGVGEPAGRIA